MNAKDLTVVELKKHYKYIWEQIYVIECYGSNDLRWLNSLEEELIKRGYEVRQNSCPKIIKM